MPTFITMMPQTQVPLVKLMSIGDSLVGKTSFLSFFLVGSFVSLPSTIGIDYKEIEKVRSQFPL